MVVNKRNCLIGILLMMLLLLPASSAQAATLTRVGLSINGSTVRLTGTGNLLDSQGNIMAHLTGTNACEVTASLGQLWLGGASFSQLRVVPTGAGAQSYLQVNGKAYRGELVISASSSGIKVVNEVDLEDYLLGVVALEMTPTWPLEALKAQAVA
ncbi:MAG: SpoIID/LytB domain-containing protein, partial [bacterium]